jgi:hypothetical protein
MIYKALILRNKKLEFTENINLREDIHIFGIWGFSDKLVLPQHEDKDLAIDWCQKNGKLLLINV